MVPGEMPGRVSIYLRKHRSEFYMDLLVVPISGDDALAWIRGEKSDDEIKPSEKPEAVFFRRCPSRSEYRRGLRQVYQHFKKGAVCYVARTSIPSVARFLKRRGAIATMKEVVDGVEYHRYIILPKDFVSWMQRVKAL